jgi:hypothetical protein
LIGLLLVLPVLGAQRGTTRHPGYRINTIKRKRIEEPFEWMKTVGGLRKTRHRGRGLVEWFFVLTAAWRRSASSSTIRIL